MTEHAGPEAWGNRGTRGSAPGRNLPGGASRFWDAFFPRFYRLIRPTEPLLQRWLRRHRLGDTVELTVVGLRSGRPRTVLLGLLEVGDRRYVGHPSTACAWTRNLDAAEEATLTHPGGATERVRARLLAASAERDAVIRATFRQHPFPGDVLYWLARGHVRGNGRFYRLEPAE